MERFDFSFQNHLSDQNSVFYVNIFLKCFKRPKLEQNIFVLHKLNVSINPKLFFPPEFHFVGEFEGLFVCFLSILQWQKNQNQKISRKMENLVSAQLYLKDPNDALARLFGGCLVGGWQGIP